MDKRNPDNGPEAENATVNDPETAKVGLGAGGDRDEMIEGVQGVAARMAQLTIVNAPRTEGDAAVQAYEEPLEVQEVNPVLSALKEQYGVLSEKDRTYNGKVRTWAEVVKAIASMPDFLEGVATLTEAKVYFLNEKGQLVVGDGCSEPPEVTRKLDYYKSRTAQTRISYLDTEGRLVVVNGDDVEIPADAKVLSEKGLIKLEEYRRVNKGQFEQDNFIWVESGKHRAFASVASSLGDMVCFDAYYGGVAFWRIGSRGVLRVNLNFES